ncbi:hypothetical protein ACI0FR_02557 [Paenochrobactrum sp. BZR 201-1]
MVFTLQENFQKEKDRFQSFTDYGKKYHADQPPQLAERLANV